MPALKTTIVRAKSALTLTYVSGLASPYADTGNTEDANQDFSSSSGVADRNRMGRKWTAPATGKLKSVTFLLGKTGTPAGTLGAFLLTDDGGTPSLPVRQVGEDTSSITCNDLNAAAGGASQEISWAEGHEPDVVSGTDYWVVLKTAGYTYEEAVTEVRWRTDANGAVGLNECVKFDPDGQPVWSSIGADVGADFTVTYKDQLIGLDGFNQLMLYVDFTIGSSAGLNLKVEFSDDKTNWVQEITQDILAGAVTDYPAEHGFLATDKYRVPLPVCDRYAKVSVKAITDATNAQAGVTAVAGTI